MKAQVSKSQIAGLIVILLSPWVSPSVSGQVASNCCPRPTGLINWWRAEGNAQDSAGTNHGTGVGAVGFAPGKVGQAFVLDGSSWISIADAPGLNFGPASPITIELWAYRTGSQNAMHLVGKRNGCLGLHSEINYQMGIEERYPQPELFGLFFGAGPSNQVTTGITMPLNVWMHLAGVFDGSNFRLYTNGVLAAAATGQLGPVTTQPLLIGGSDNCQKFVGLIDEVSLYNRALSAPEIQAIYNAGAAGKCATLLAIYPAVELEYPMTRGAIYQLQATANLSGPWWDVGSAVLGEDCMESAFESTREGDRKFWRVSGGVQSNVMDFSRARSLCSTNYILFENVQWRGTNYEALYRIGSTAHQIQMSPLRTFQVPTATIATDGDASDWSSVPVLYQDLQHDQVPPDGHPGTDIKQVKIARDAVNLYMAYWLYDAAPPQDGTFYLTELQQYLHQIHTPGDTMIVATYSIASAQWQVQVQHRETPGATATYPSSFVGVGDKFIEYRVPIADVEYDGGGALSKVGIEGRFLRTYAHYVQDGDPGDPLSTYDGAGEDQKVLIVNFY